MEYEVSNDELELFTRCFKNYLGEIRMKFRKISVIIVRDKISSKLLMIYSFID